MRRVAIDIETTVSHGDRASPYLDDIHCISVNEDGQSWFVKSPLELEDILEDPDIVKIFHGGSFDIQFLLHRINDQRMYDLRVANVWDTLIAERLLTAGKNVDCGLASVTESYCNVTLNKNIRESFRHHSGPMNDIQRQYALRDVEFLDKISRVQQEKLEERGMSDIVEVENSLVPLVAEMELRGIGFNPEAWDVILQAEQAALPAIELSLQKQLSETFVYDIFAGGFVGTVNLNSPDQLKDALNRLGIEVENTQESTLSALDHPIGREIADYREHSKRLQWDYPKYINPVTKRIHPNIVQTGADTGRFSCKNPNLQNVPHDQLFRDMFVSRPGWVFIIADYGQQELRVMAECSQDKNLLRVCREEDPHLANARLMYSDPTIVKADPRRTIAKGGGFALVYGASSKTMGHSLGLSRKDANRVHKLLHHTYHGVDVWGEKSWKFLITNGYVTTLGGRRRYFPWAYQDPGKYRTVARNTPIQGTSADMMKRAMLEVDRRVYPLGARVLLCVHDELIVESPIEAADQVMREVENGMIIAGEYYVKSVPTIVDAVISSVWQKG